MSTGDSVKVQLGNPNSDARLSYLAEHLHHPVVLSFDNRTEVLTLQSQLVYDDKSRARGSFRSIGHYVTISFSVKFKWFLKLQNEDGLW